MECNLPGSSVYGILQARILEWVAMPFTRGSSPPRDWTHVSYIYLYWQAGSLLLAPPGKPQLYGIYNKKLNENGFITFLWLEHLFLFMIVQMKERSKKLVLKIITHLRKGFKYWNYLRGRVLVFVAKSWTWLSDFTFTFHFHALEREMATHSSVLAWRIPETGEPGGLLSMGSHRVGHDWHDLAAGTAANIL